MIDENLIVTLVAQKVIADTFRRLPVDKKDLIYRTAIRLFAKYGYDGLPVERICHEATISKGSFFQYFATKSHLLEFCLLLFDSRMMRLFEDIRRREHAGLARSRLMFAYESMIASDLTTDERQFYLFALFGLRHAGIEIAGIEIERHFRLYIHEIIVRGVDTGELRGDYETDLTANYTAALLERLVERSFTDSKPPIDEAGEYLESFLFDGIKS